MRVIVVQLYFFLISALSAYAVPNLAGQFVSQFYMTYDYMLSKTLAPPPDFNFWRSVEELGEKAVHYVDDQLDDSSLKFADAASKIEEFKSSMRDLVDSVADLGIGKSSSLNKRGLDVEGFSDKLSNEIDLIIQQLMLEFSEPLPEDQTERYKKREAVVSWTLDKIEDALVKACIHLGMSESEAREKFSHIKPHIQHVVLVVGNLSDNHPFVVDLILFSAAVMLVPESLVLRPILGAFGFGPLGPVEGSAAAWLQRFFFRTAIKKGSWFSRLQRAGMRWTPPGMGKKIGAGVGAGAGVIGGLRACI